MIACDWWGMSKYDVASVVEMLITDVSDFVIVPDRLTQGMINALLLMRLMKVCVPVQLISVTLEIEVSLHFCSL